MLKNSAGMSLLRYFHKEPKETAPHVSNVSGTECALSVVEQQNIKDNLASISQADIKSKRKRPRPEKYKTTDGTQRLEIANHAIRHGFIPTAKKFGVAESTICSYVKRSVVADSGKRCAGSNYSIPKERGENFVTWRNRQ